MLSGMTRQRLNKRCRHALRILHFASALGWFGAGLAQLVTGIMVMNSADVLIRHYAFELGGTSGQVVCAPLAIIAAVTGIMLGALTEWGLLRHWWIVVKLVLTVGIIIFGSVVLSSLSGQVATETAATTNPDAGVATAQTALIGGCVNIGVLLAVTVISVIKPWGRRSSREDGLNRPGRGGDFQPHHAKTRVAVSSSSS
jgi:hypothetical protein